MSVQEVRRRFCGSGAPRAPGVARKLQAQEMLMAESAYGRWQGKLCSSAEGSQTCLKNCKGMRSEVTIHNANVI